MATVGQKQTDSIPPTEIGSILAQRYEVVRELGRGGMGVVYLCRDVVTGDRVALKRLRSPRKEPLAPRRAGGSSRKRAPWRSWIIRRSCAREISDNSPTVVPSL